MNLNRIEQRFFDDVLQANLDAPATATLRVGDEEFSVMVIPQFSQNNYFELRYFGTPAYSPLDEDSAVSFGGGHIFGVNSVMENAWNNQGVVDLEFTERPAAVAPFLPIVGPTIQAKVLVVEPAHEGRLSVHKNQVKRKDSTLKQVEFSLVDFSDFEKIEHITEHMARHMNVQESLETIRKEFPDAVEVKIVRPARISLQTGQGWEVTLTKDAEQSRNHTSHSGLITRTDGEEFEIDDMDDLLEGLNYFFAFVSCAYRHPTAIIGEDSQGKAVWGQIGKFDLMPRSTNWFDNDSNAPATIYLEGLFPKFWEQWQKHPNELASIIESLTNSKAMQQAGLPKEALTACYTGLELLAAVVLNNSKNNVANVCQALARHSIPHLHLDPSKTPITVQLAKNLSKSNSGPHLIYDIRNYVTHPQDRRSNKIKQAYLEHLDDTYSPYFYLNDLCHFYLEYLLLIGLCGWQPDDFRILAERR